MGCDLKSLAFLALTPTSKQMLVLLLITVPNGVFAWFIIVCHPAA
jgi:hypothetical protein